MCLAHRPTMSSNFSADSHPPGGVGRGLTSVDCEDIGITKIYTMNIRGLTDDKERTLVRRMQQQNIDVIAVQETHLYGSGSKILLDLNNIQFTFVYHGPERPDGCTRKMAPSNGVAPPLSPKAAKLWDRKEHKFGERLLALRFGGRRGCMVGSAYAPHTGRDLEERVAFQDNLLECEAFTKDVDRLLIGMDANATVGMRDAYNVAAANDVLGRFGRPRRSASGGEFVNTLATAGMVVVNTFFRKKHYGTWMHPGTKDWHALDHFVCRVRDRKEVRDCGVRERWIATDHKCVGLLLHAPKRVRCGRRNNIPRRKPDRRLLQDADTRATYRQVFEHYVNDNATATTSTTPYQTLLAGVKVADKVITVAAKQRQDWYSDSLPKMEAVTRARAAAQSKYDKKPSAELHVELRHARTAVKVAKGEAKVDWIDKQAVSMSDTLTNPRAVWDAVNKIKEGLGLRTKSQIPLMMKADKSISATVEESAEVFAKHFGPLFGFDTQVDESVLETKWKVETAEDGSTYFLNTETRETSTLKPDGLVQHPVIEELDTTPTLEEVTKHIKKMRCGKAAGLDGITTDHFKALSGLEAADELILRMVVEFWEELEVDPEWLVSKLALLPKSGNIKDPNRWRALCLMQVAAKLVTSIMADRLQTMLLKDRGLETQQGFTSKRGCADGIWNFKMALSKRREFGKETYASLIDLVKAFDTVDRDTLWTVFARYGVPRRMIERIKLLYDGSTVEMGVEGVKVTFSSTAGVKQGDGLSPILFLIIVQAAFDSMVWPDGCDPIFFKTCLDGVVASRKTSAHETMVTSVGFEVREGLYADDAQLLFASHNAMEVGTSELVHHLGRFGLVCHYAPEGTLAKDLVKTSKSQCMWFPSYSVDVKAAAVPVPIKIDGFTIGNRIFPAGCMPFVPKFKYLGAVLNQELTDVDDVNSRIAAAAWAFGEMRPVLTQRLVPLHTKRKLYISTVLSLALYGAENWSSLESSLAKLEVFHNRCVRVMLGINRWEQRRRRLTTKTLNEMLDIYPVSYYVDQRTLRWIGHLQRMEDDRLPKMLFFSWVPDGKRRRGGQEKRFGRRAQELLLDMAERLPQGLARVMRGDQNRKAPGFVSANVDIERHKEWCKRNKEVQPKWKTTAAMTEKWLTCSTWTLLAEDRGLWKEAVGTYLVAKYEQTDA